MNKVVPTILAISTLLVTAGCSSSGTSHSSSYSGMKATHANYTHASKANYAHASKANYHSAGHAHSNHGGNAIRHSHAGGVGHAHNGYSAGYGYTVNSAGRNAIVNTSARSAAATSGGGSGASIAKIAGALFVGGLIYNATKSDNDDGNSSTTGSGCMKPADCKK